MNYSPFAVPFLPHSFQAAPLALPKPNFMPPHNFFPGEGRENFLSEGRWRTFRCPMFRTPCCCCHVDPAPRCSFSFLILLYIPDASPYPLFALSSPPLWWEASNPCGVLSDPPYTPNRRKEDRILLMLLSQVLIMEAKNGDFSVKRFASPFCTVDVEKVGALLNVCAK